MKPAHQLPDDDLAQAACRATAQPDAPLAWQQAAVALWRQAAPARLLSQAATAAQRLLQPLRAALRFDSWASAGLALDMRSAASETHQLLFGVEGLDIDLRIAAEAEAYTLSGQVLGGDPQGVAELVSQAAGGAAHTATLDELGEFTITGLLRGAYVLRLHLSGAVVELPPIDVRERGL